MGRTDARAKIDDVVPRLEQVNARHEARALDSVLVQIVWVSTEDATLEQSRHVSECILGGHDGDDAKL